MEHFAERNIIAAIARQQVGTAVDLVRGIGDDCAVVRKAGGLVDLWTTDALVEGVHFDLTWHPPELLGRKAASVNISDIGAMGGRPRFALLALGLPAACRKELLDKMVAGFLDVLAEHDMVLVGGDTVYAGERLLLSITVCGEMAEKQVCYRSAARPGDLVWVSGCLGNAACGLELCRQGWQGQEEYALLCRAHLDPQPQVRLGRLLADSGLIHAMMDISDGLATDLAHICQASGVGAEIMAEEVPLAGELQKAAAALHLSPMQLALQGGEDYQLVFSAPAQNSEPLRNISREAGVDIACVGRIVAGAQVMLRQDGEWRDISFQGYEHRF
ncbi:MAG: thiamine-phosphate kinase [Proteobacteria bacterium]|nr:thiamine-phosphate kinase [Pseudomonadota bacterium]MBU4296193.1 thiamine-phosphate kinase [Pseudomonadota bacterium]MCG2749655.1 thiamine-phosphate kinase [Desulfobulbaceae bacterium]